MATQDNARRRHMELEARRKQAAPPVEEKEQVSVLQDSKGLKEAAIKASNGGKKRIVGLYLPDGQRIVVEEKKKKETKEAEQKEKSKKAQLDVSKKDFHAEEKRKKANLSEVNHTYNLQRQLKVTRATREKKSEEELEDEESRRIAKGVLTKTNDIERSNYNNLFDFFDVDNDATWGSIEFAQRMTDIGFSTGVEDAANLLYFAGVRDVDRITYNDFLAMMPKLKAYRRIIEKDAMRAFSEKDTGSGYISLKSLREVLFNLAGPEGLDPKFVESILKKSDRERTGRIPFDFFMRALFGSPPLLPYKRDMKAATLSQRFLSNFGRCCGAAAKPRQDIDDEEEDDRA